MVTQNIKTDELKANIGKDDWVIVDTRANDAFNGWALDGVKRGGHIKDAVDFSADWLKVKVDKQDEKLTEVLKSKGITTDKNVVLYDANGKDAQNVVEYLQDKGFKNMYKYDVKEWAENQDLALEAYPNYEMLVPSSWVNDLINNKNYGNPYKIFEVSWEMKPRIIKTAIFQVPSILIRMR